MPYPLPAGGIIECQYRCTLHAQQCINVFHYRIPDAYTGTSNELPTLLDSFELKVASKIYAIQSEQVSNIQLQIQVVHPQRYVYYRRDAAVANGETTGTAMPSGVSAVVRRRSELANRSSRGRIYIPGISLGATAQSELTPAWLAANELSLRVMMYDPIEDGFTTPFPAVIWSYADRAHNDVVVSAEVDPVIRYQRRREVRVGI